MSIANMFYKLSIICLITGILILYMLSEKPFDEGIVCGRNVLITGASSGIGEQMAYTYSSMGANVFITARREDLLKQVVEKCKTLGPSGSKYGYYVADMADYKVKSKLLIKEAVSFLGSLDTLVLNHGILGKKIVWYGSQEDLDMFDHVLRVDALSYIHIASYALPYLKSNSKYGRLGVVSAVFGKTEVATYAPYVTAKFSLDGFFSSLRTELTQARQNISVTLSVIGATDTDMLSNAIHADGKRLNITAGDIIARNLQKYTGQPDATAYQIISATELGLTEHYYPDCFGATKFPFPACLVSVIRHLLGSEYTQSMEMTQQFYEKYDKRLNNK